MPDSSADPLTQILSTEHRLIRRAVVLLGRYCAKVRAMQTFDPALARQFLRFFRGFAEDHHRKEEEVLFPWLQAHGVADEGGPLAILRAEHEEARDLLDALHSITEVIEERPDDLESLACFSVFGERYARLIAEHEWKENHVVYPIADYLDAPSHELLVEHHEGYESCLEDPHEFHRWIEDIEALASAWPKPDVDLRPTDVNWREMSRDQTGIHPVGSAESRPRGKEQS